MTDEFSKVSTSTSPIGIYIVQDGRFKLVSPQFQKLSGDGEDELLGLGSLMLGLPEDRSMVREDSVKMLELE